MSELPLEGIVVLEFCQYLSGPSAGLRLADLGARVIKIERPGFGDACRKLSIKDLWVDDSSLLFHTINRNKESFAADLRNPDHLQMLKKLVASADVLIHNFRPGVMEKSGLGYEEVCAINPSMIYAEISGYGKTGPWKAKPGQDLLLQSMTGLASTTGNGTNGPVPFGIAIADILCGAQLVQAIIGALIRREKTKAGALIEISLMESLLDFQFELLTTYFASGTVPERSQVSNGHPLLGAPYGIFATSDGYIALAMMDIHELAQAIDCEQLRHFELSRIFASRDEIKTIVADHLSYNTTANWLSRLHHGGLWAMEVLDWSQMIAHDSYKVLKMEQEISAGNSTIITSRCPIRINGKRITSEKAAPSLGEHNLKIVAELNEQNGQHPKRASHDSSPALLNGLTVVDLSQFLSGPSAGLRLADMGARVIKIERPGTGDICRQLYVSDVMVEGESTIFHAINRNKQSYAADLKNLDDLEKVKQIIAKADVLLHNFRPGVIERLGLDYDSVTKFNPSIIYAEVSGYGNEGPWKDLPGQDLLLQSVSGLTWLSNNNDEGPTPMGVAVVDILAGTHVAQGILAALHKRNKDGKPALVQVSMFESILDFQFEVLTCYYNDGNQLPVRSAVNSAHAYVAAPYGIYKTSNGYIALAMGNITQLAKLLSCDNLLQFADPGDWFLKRDIIKETLSKHLEQDSSEHWLRILEPADVWCAPVMNYERLRKEQGYKELNMEMEVTTGSGLSLTTTRCPFRIDGRILNSPVGAPSLGEHNAIIDLEFEIGNQDQQSTKAHERTHH